MFRHYNSLRFGKRMCRAIARQWYGVMYIVVRGSKMKVVLRDIVSREYDLLGKETLNIYDRKRSDRATA